MAGVQPGPRDMDGRDYVLGGDLRNGLRRSFCSMTRCLFRSIQACAAASVAKLLTVVGALSGIFTSTPNTPLGRSTIL
ncbi:MAG TPA: hypothetical protein VMB84_05845 [Stellaceae bacterium]|nr:hypothetical protein [Stellaceae bacterium]